VNPRVASFLLLVLMVDAVAGAPGPAAGAQVAVPPSFDLGYGPSTLFPISQGTPVFSAGDQLWARSHYNSTLVLMVSPYFPSNTTYFLGPVEPETPTRLLLVNDTDPQGMWSIQVVNSSQPPVLFLVSNAASAPSDLTMTEARLNGGALDMNFTTSPSPQLQDAQACTLGSQDPSAAVVPVPPIVGGGTVALVMDGNRIEATASGPGAGNFTLQVDLYYPYAFLAPNSTSIILFRSARAATTGPVLITRSNPSASMVLQTDGRLKSGRYELRVFFGGPQGISLAPTEVLVPGANSWVWLGTCQITQVYSNDFTIAAPLGADPSTWPRTLWLTYNAFGQQGFANLSLGVNLAALTFMGVPWQVPLSSYDIRAVASTGTRQIDVQNGTMYLILSSPEASANYTVGLGGQTFFTGAVGPIEPFTSAVIPLNVSQLAVTHFVGGLAHEGSTVSVSNSAGELISAETNKNGQVMFYLPAGAYNVTAAGGNSTESQSVTLPLGQKFALDLGLQTSTGTSDMALGWALGAIAAAGVVVNVILFLGGRKRKP